MVLGFSATHAASHTICLDIATGVGVLVLWLIAGLKQKWLLALENIEWKAIFYVVNGVNQGCIDSRLWHLASRRLGVGLAGWRFTSGNFALVRAHR